VAYLKIIYTCHKCNNRVAIVETDRKPVAPKCSNKECGGATMIKIEEKSEHPRET
jgi:hypothetical protein